MFTGTLIDDLIATVERAERMAQPDEVLICEPWIVSSQANADCDSELPMWQESGVA